MKFNFFHYTAVRWRIVTFLFVSCFTSCTFYKQVEVKEVLAVNISEFSLNTVTGDVQVSITNPNWYKVILQDCHIDFTFEGKPLGSAELLERVVIPKKTTSTQTFSIKANPQHLKSILGDAITLFFKSEYVLEGKGYVKGKALGVAKSFPVAFKETLSKEDLGL